MPCCVAVLSGEDVKPKLSTVKKKLWKLVSEKASKIRGFPWRDVMRDGSNKFVGSNGTEIITCKEGVQKMNHLWRRIEGRSLSALYKKIGANMSWGTDQRALSNQVKSYLPGAIQKMTNSAKDAAGQIKQQLMISSILKGSEQKTRSHKLPTIRQPRRQTTRAGVSLHCPRWISAGSPGPFPHRPSEGSLPLPLPG